MNKVILDTKKLDAIIKKYPRESDEIIRKTAFEVEGRTKRNIAAYPLIDTGALFNGILAEPSKGKELTWEVHDSVEYGIYWELGHHLRNGVFVKAKPFLLPALLSVEQWFLAQWHRLFEAL